MIDPNEQLIDQMQQMLDGIKEGRLVVIDASLTFSPQGVETYQDPSSPLKTYIDKQTVSLSVKCQANTVIR